MRVFEYVNFLHSFAVCWGNDHLLNILLSIKPLSRRGTDAWQVCCRYLLLSTSEESTNCDGWTKVQDASAMPMTTRPHALNVSATRATGGCCVIPREVSLSRALLSPCCTGCRGGRLRMMYSTTREPAPHLAHWDRYLDLEQRAGCSTRMGVFVSIVFYCAVPS